MNSYEMHYKEASPQDTVWLLLKKLYGLGIKVTEHWNEDPIAETASLRVNILNSVIGTNGKGVTREYARASAYGEFFERLQNDILCTLQFKDRASILEEFGFVIAPDEKYLQIEELIKQNDAYIRFVLEQQDALNMPLQKQVEKIQELCYRHINEEGQILGMPFYDVKHQKVVYLPSDIYINHYGSNGMAAGNSPAEALVQGMSEIIERVVQRKIHIEKPCLPEIPLEKLKRYPYLYERYKKLRENTNYNIRLIDCSFGGKYPVAGLIVLEKNTGKYGLKLGCHADYRIAIERTITEASQGQLVTDYSERSIFDFMNQAVDEETNITNGYKYGRAQFPYQLFGSNPTYEYYDFETNSQKTNEDFLAEWTEKIIADGFEIYIRDNSYLGFPTYHIIIPGLSEIDQYQGFVARASNTLSFSKKLLSHIENVDVSNCKYIIATMQYYSNDLFMNRLTYYMNRPKGQRFPYEDINCDVLYFIAMCYVLMEDYEKAYKNTSVIEQAAYYRRASDHTILMIHVVNLYLSGMIVEKNHDTVIDYLRQLYDEDIIQTVDDIFSDPSKVLIQQYSFEENEQKNELHNNVLSIIRKLREANAANPINQNSLKKVFEFSCVDEEKAK